MDYNGILENNLAVDNCYVIDATWHGCREGDESHAKVRRLDDRGSTREISVIALHAHGNSVVAGPLAFDDLAVVQLQRKLRQLRDCTSSGVVACDAGVFEFWF